MLELKRTSKTNDEKDLICTQTAEHQTNCIILYTTDIKTLVSLALASMHQDPQCRPPESDPSRRTSLSFPRPTKQSVKTHSPSDPATETESKENPCETSGCETLDSWLSWPSDREYLAKELWPFNVLNPCQTGQTHQHQVLSTESPTK